MNFLSKQLFLSVPLRCHHQQGPTQWSLETALLWQERRTLGGSTSTPPGRTASHRTGLETTGRLGLPARARSPCPPAQTGSRSGSVRGGLWTTRRAASAMIHRPAAPRVPGDTGGTIRVAGRATMVEGPGAGRRPLVPYGTSSLSRNRIRFDRT